jgi:hypothetical protein
MNSEAWCGLTVRTRDGTVLGVVAGVFAHGPLAGRLRVHGDYRRWTSWTGTAVYAIPRQALVRGKQHSLVLDATPAQARDAWLVQVWRRPAPAPLSSRAQRSYSQATEPAQGLTQHARIQTP